MDPLYTPTAVRTLLKRYGLRPDKSFGQNFLVDGNILRGVVQAAELTPGDHVLEIGPGLGVLTRALAERAGSVTSVELDARLLDVLAETVGELSNVTVIHGDGLEFDLIQLPEESVLVANLPYNVGTPILLRGLESGRFKRAVVMVQKEVAERLSAQPGDPGFGALSLIVAQYGRVEHLKNVKPSAFFPPPEVTSSVVRLTLSPESQADPELNDLIHQAFKHRRKTLQKNLLMAGWPKAEVTRALNATGLGPQVRAEALSLAQFRALQRHLA